MARSKDALMVVKTDINMAALEATTSTLVEHGSAVQFFLDKAELLQQVGRIQGLDFARRVGDIAIAKIFDEIKIAKKYKGLPYIDESGKPRHSGDLEEFCRVFLGKSYNRCLELSQNMHLLGEDLYESTQKIGFRARDYAALRALPEDEQNIIKQAIETQSRDAVIEMLEDMAVRHAAQKAELTKELGTLREESIAKDSVIAHRSETINKLQTKKAMIKPPTPDEDGAKLRRETSDWVCEAEGIIRGPLRDGLEQLAQHYVATDINHEEFCSGLLAQLQRALSDIGGQLLIKAQPDGDSTPEWART